MATSEDDPKETPQQPAAAPAEETPAPTPAKITYKELWDTCSYFHGYCLDLDRRFGPSPTSLRRAECFVRLCNMVNLFELHEAAFMDVVKRGRRK